MREQLTRRYAEENKSRACIRPASIAVSPNKEISRSVSKAIGAPRKSDSALIYLHTLNKIDKLRG
jgi:hypothetical protein